MSNYTDRTTVSVFVNGESAEQALNRLKTRATSTAEALERAMAAGDNKSAKKLQRELDKITKEINRTESAAKGCGTVLGDISNSSIKGLQNTLRYLQKEISATKPNTEQWEMYADQIRQVKERLGELNEEMQGSGSTWDQFKEWAQQSWFALDMIGSAGETAINAMQESVDAYASMDAEMANVRKFTGMTADEVERLNAEFKNMDTRTSREGLNQLAQEAGRLGKTTQEDVLGFVRAADQINVALDDLGEGATLTLSKLTGVFGDEAKYGTEQSLLKVGSVINELSQNCAAGAPFLAEFASRMGGVGAQANMTIPQIMAYGAVLDSAGMNVEASSTALSQVIVRFMQEPAKYAKVAGMDVKKFSDLLRTDVNGAVVMFLESLNKAGGIDTLSPMFKDMGETGSQAIATLSTLATHIDQVKAQQVAANEAFEAGTSISNEFSVQNTTVQASLDKATKAATELKVELGQQLAPLMAHALNYTAAMSRAVVVLVRYLMENKSTIISLAAGITAYSIVLHAATIKTALMTAGTKVLNVALAIQKAAWALSGAALNLFSGNLTKASAMMRVFNTTIKANPIGLLIAGVTTAITAISQWVSKSNDAIRASREAAKERAAQERDFQTQISDTSKAASDYASKELDRLKKLYNATQDATKSQRERIAAVKELQQTYPTAFGNLSQEKILAGQAAGAYKNLAQNILRAAKAKAIADKIKENEAKLLELDLEREGLEESIGEDSKSLDKERDRRKRIARAVSRRNQNSVFGPSGSERRALENSQNRIDTLDANLDANSEKLEQNMTQSSQIRTANEKLAGKLNESDLTAYSFEDPVVAPTGGYTSQVVANKDKKRQEAEKRRADAKAKKEFKASLDKTKADFANGEAEILKATEQNNLSYEEVMKRRYENEVKYYDAALKVYEDTFAGKKDSYLEDDKDYQELLLKKEKAEEKWAEQSRKLEIEAIKRTQAAKEAEIQREYALKKDPTLEDEIKLQADLYAVRKKSLEDQRDQYAKGSKERADLELAIAELTREKEFNQEKLYLATVSNLRNQYEKKSAAERFKLEKATLDTLLNAKKISEEEYQTLLKALRKKYDAEDTSELADETKELGDSYEAQLKLLENKLANELILQEEYEKRKQKLKDDYLKKGLDELKKNGGEWDAVFVDIYTSFAKLVAELGQDTGNTISNIGKATAALSAAVSAGMQIASEFAKAETSIQTAEVEKRYARELELAQGNSVKTAQIEKKKEAEIAKIKSEASKKQFAMQVIAAIAQTATNAISAYGAALQTGPAGLVLAPIAAAIAVAQGTLQVALLKKQQKAAEMTGYSKGGFTKPGAVNEPAGIVHAGEWVASQKLVNSPKVRPLLEALDYAQRTNTIGRLNAGDVSRSIRANDTMARAAENGDSYAIVASAMAQNAGAVKALHEKLAEPIAAVVTVMGDQGIKAKQEEAERLLRNVTPKSRR